VLYALPATAFVVIGRCFDNTLHPIMLAVQHMSMNSIMKAEQSSVMDIKVSLLPYTEPPSCGYNIKLITAVKEIKRCNCTNRAMKTE